MKIIMVHNLYQISGGEDSVFYEEVKLLKRENDVIEYVVSNDNLSSFWTKVSVFFSVVFSVGVYSEFKRLLKDTAPDIVHVHNYFPKISPAIFYACKSMEIPVVHTLHNYRAICPTALLMHNGKVEERSIKGSVWWCVTAKVYRQSMLGSFALAMMVSLHKKIGTWQSKVDRFIALTHFAKDKYIEAGWPSDRIVVKPNFVDDPFNGVFFEQEKENFGIYIGRLSEEKGIDTLIEAWKSVDYKLVVVGDGPLSVLLESCSNPNIHYVGRKSKVDVLALMSSASFIVMASRWYEGFPMVLVEAMANGTCAVVPRLGGMAEVVLHGKTGLHFEPGSAVELQKACLELINKPELCNRLNKNARIEYESKYTAIKNYEMIMDIYMGAIKEITK